MGYLSNASDINQIFVIEPLSLTGGSPTVSACTSVYSNELLSCSGNTTILLGDSIINFNGDLFTNNNLTASTINASTYYSGDTELMTVINNGNISSLSFIDNTLSITTIDNSIYNITIDNFSGITVNGGINANSLSATTIYGDGSNLTAIPFWTNGGSGAYSIKAKNLTAIDSLGNYSFAVGFDTKAIGDYSHAEGYATTATGISNHSEGFSTFANSNYSHAEGWYTIAFGEGSHAEGGQTTASGKYSHAGGTGSSVTGDYSFIHSTNSTLSGKRSVLLGGKNLNGNTDDTVYVPYLNISSAYTGTSVAALGIDANGFVVTGITISDYLSLSGGTLTGPLYGTTISANTISATTFYGDGSNLINIHDTFVTGGTPNNNTRVYTFTNNTGGTFTVNALNDIFVTGGTYSNGVTTFTNSTGGTFNVSGYYTGATDVFVTGGTPNNNTRVYTFTNNTGGTFSVSGLIDITVTGATYSNGSITFTNNTGGTFTTSGLYTGATDVFVTGGTYSNGTTTFTNNTGGTFNVTGFYTGATDVFVTGGTPNNNTRVYTFTNNTGGTFSVNSLTDVTITGGSYSNGTAIFTNNTGGTFNVSGFFKPSDDIFTTGLTFNTNTYDLKITRNDGTVLTQNLAILASDMTITGGTYNPNTGVATFTNNTGCLLYTSPSPRDRQKSRMPSSA